MDWLLEIDACSDIQDYFYFIDQLLSNLGVESEFIDAQVTGYWHYFFLYVVVEVRPFMIETVEKPCLENLLLHPRHKSSPLFRSNHYIDASEAQ